MPATPSQVNDARALVQGRADAEGSKGAKYTFGTTDSVIDLGGPNGKVLGGRSWESGGGVGPMEILLRGILDAVLDVVLRDTDPVGTIKMFSGLAVGIPYGWAICNGGNGTPDLREKFILGSETSGGTGGSGTTSQPTPNQSGTPSETIYPTVLTAGTELATGAHTHSIAHTHTHTPPFYRLIFIMKIAPP